MHRTKDINEVSLAMLKRQYKRVKSYRKLATMYGVSVGTIANRLRKHPNTKLSISKPLTKKIKVRKYTKLYNSFNEYCKLWLVDMDYRKTIEKLVHFMKVKYNIKGDITLCTEYVIEKCFLQYFETKQEYISFAIYKAREYLFKHYSKQTPLEKIYIETCIYEYDSAQNQITFCRSLQLNELLNDIVTQIHKDGKEVDTATVASYLLLQGYNITLTYRQLFGLLEQIL
jgi:hypothetical protein